MFTNDTARPWAEAVAIKGERVVAVGDDTAIGALTGPSTRVIDAGGRVVIPGLNDARVDLPLAPPTAETLTALDRRAIAQGVTSLQVVAGGPMRALVAAAQQATRQARWRLIRSPMDGERPQDEEPFLPPQPGDRLVANGVNWVLGSWWDRRSVERGRLDTIVKWAYGAQDPIIVSVRGEGPEGGETGGRSELAALLDAMRRLGVRDVWLRKRPRLDLRGRVPIDPRSGTPGFPVIAEAVDAAYADFRALGIVVVAVPIGFYERTGWKDTSDLTEPESYEKAGLHVAVGSGWERSLVTAMADFLDFDRKAREATVRAATLGSAYAEQGERDKGWIGPGALADIAVMSGDVFAETPDRLREIASVLTIVGGAIVYDPGVLATAFAR